MHHKSYFLSNDHMQMISNKNAGGAWAFDNLGGELKFGNRGHSNQTWNTSDKN